MKPCLEGRTLGLRQADVTIDARALQDVEVRTREQVAAALGISRQAVEQLEKSGLRKLARAMQNWDGRCES